MPNILETAIFITPGEFINEGKKLGELTQESRNKIDRLARQFLSTMEIDNKNAVIIYKRSNRCYDATRIISLLMQADEENQISNVDKIEVDWLEPTVECFDQLEQVIKCIVGKYDKDYQLSNNIVIVIAEYDVIHPLMKMFVTKFLKAHHTQKFWVCHDKESGNGFIVDCCPVDGEVKACHF